MNFRRLFYFLLFLLLAPPAFAQSAYKLQPGDAIEVWVAQYSDLTRQIALAPDGWISLPLAGTIQAEGLTLEQLQEALTQRLKPYFSGEVGLNISLVPSDVNRPSVFVAGAVENPGVYAYRPGMTVLHAISVAGGPYRANLPVTERARVTELHGLIATSDKRMTELSVMIARLNAQIAGKTEFSPPPDINPTDAAKFVSREQALLTMQTTNMASQQASLDRLTQINSDSAKAISGQIESLTRRMTMAQERLATTSTLVERGIMPVSQVWEIEGGIVDMEGSMSQLRSTLATQQGAMITEENRLSIVTQEYQAGLITQLAASEQAQEELLSDISNYRQMLEIFDPNVDGTSTLRYEIMRTGEGDGIIVDATEQTEILPGDLVRVTQTSLADRLPPAATEATGANEVSVPAATETATPPIAEEPAAEPDPA